MSTKRPTLKAIGEQAGVSAMTVSLALRGDRRISKSTRVQIHKHAEVMGWRPNPALSRMMTEIRNQDLGRLQEVVAVLTGEARKDQESDLFLNAINQGVFDRLDKLGYEQVWFAANAWKGKEKAFQKMIRTRRIRGMVLGPFLPNEIFDALDLRDLAIANVAYSQGPQNLHRSLPDQHENVMLLMDHLKSIGYQRIGFLTTLDIDERVGHRWLSAFLGFQLQGDIGRVPPLIRPVRGVTEDDFQTWCKKYKPDAVITTRYEPMSWTQAKGFKGPKQADLFCPGVSSPHGPYKGIDEQIALVGAAGVDLVTSQMTRNEFGLPETPKTILIPGKILNRSA